MTQSGFVFCTDCNAVVTRTSQEACGCNPGIKPNGSQITRNDPDPVEDDDDPADLFDWAFSRGPYAGK